MIKKYVLLIFLGLGWVFFGFYLLLTLNVNKLSADDGNSFFSPVSWENHLQLFEGAIQCSLSEDDLFERKKILKDKIFRNVVKKEELFNGVVYYFNDNDLLLDNVLEFVLKEKACCPFFKFDISILPFRKGFALHISGSEEAIEMLRDFEGDR